MGLYLGILLGDFQEGLPLKLYVNLRMWIIHIICMKMDGWFSNS